ncbi:amidohydrolase [uncultured Erythrobacter sp.]|uniref:amidohydrolase family protein n=1 Tax=uncultured Erythrobacter sp. TaxID=263913 RepID=UPI002620B76B|nr:amidohydrolase [uncultured Erythrobacter sp.]
MTRVDTLITGGHVLTMDEGFTEYADGAVAVKSGKIVECGQAQDLTARYQADETLDADSGIIMPGLINGHCHAAMSLFRGYAENVTLDAFLETLSHAETNYVSSEGVYVGASVACAEMALGGITSFVDMYWYPDETIRAARELHMSIVAGPVFVAFPGYDDLAEWPMRTDFSGPFADRHRGTEGVFPSLAPHACYTLDEEKLTELAGMAEALDLPIQIHASEAPSEMELVRDGYGGATPIEVLDRTGVLHRNCQLAHAVHLSDSDIALIKKAGASIIHNPQSNTKLASGIARICDLLEAGVSVGLGTDGPSSGNDLDMWKAMRLAANLQSVSRGEPGALSDRDAVALATRLGAQAAGMGAHTGSLEPGKNADVIVVSTKGLHMRPVFSPYAALVYSAGRDDVAHVFASGHHIVKDRALQWEGFDDILSDFETITKAVAADVKVGCFGI